MRFENTDVWGFQHAIRGMRNPMNSWNKSDSGECDGLCSLCTECQYDDKDCYLNDYVGTNDMKLAQQLIRAGSEHRKFLRQIFVSVDITAPLYWWKEYDTYKIGTTANSTSTMHKLSITPITLNCFETDDYETVIIEKYEDNDDYFANDELWATLITHMEALRLKHLETKDKKYWKELIRILPESWLQTRTVTMNYENIYSMIRQRRHHKLTEWSVSFIGWCWTLPYAEELLFLDWDKKGE
ncbi:hypothetical protein [Clostridium sp. HBUAS56010]|uniref:hypothetical protein n=1 Tax=Clostridium sp. HBUAS56010 TaxID=2571127 RepID=UPI001178BFF5|nr:hypothetical protein [Clostridium sp. HBUAS56010]